MDIFGLAVQSGSGFMRDAAFAAAHELGVFDALTDELVSLDALADALGISAGRHRLRALLDVLAAFGAVACDRPAMRFSAGTVPPRPIVMHAGWGLLPDVIRGDRPVPMDGDVDARRRYHDHLASAGAAAARELARHLGDTSLIDLGAGAGAYSAAFLAEHPAARATLVDAPEVLSLAAERLQPFAGRTALLAGDASVVEACEHGAALLANVLHGHSPAMCARLCAAAARAVVPGGIVAIKDLRVDEDRAGPLESLLFALNMAIFTEGGDVYPTSQLRAWLAGAGLIDITELQLAASPDAIVVLARRSR